MNESLDSVQLLAANFFLWGTGQAQIQRTEPLVVGLVDIQFDPVIAAGIQLPTARDGLCARSIKCQGLGGTFAAVAESKIIGHTAGAIGFDIRLVVKGPRAGSRDGGMFC